MMNKEGISVSEMINLVYSQFQAIEEVRSGQNTQYELSDAIMGAFSIFHMQSRSFLDGQRELSEKLQSSNGETLYRIGKIPTDTHIRNLLDPIESQAINKCFREIIARVKRAGNLDSCRGYDGKLLIAVDGSEYHQSKNINCKKCSTRMRGEETDYYHVILAPAIVNANNNEILPLEPEFVEPQDGHNKQDCELMAFYRWLEINGKRGIIHTIRYVNELPLRMGEDAMTVNWLEYTETNEATGECLYQNEFATDYEITEKNAEEIAHAGRQRWSIENSGFNVLKNHGFNFEHNFGHGSQNLSEVLASLNLLAYLVHNVCKLTDTVYATIREKSRTNAQFFERMRVLTEVFVFDNWEMLLDIIKYRLENGRIPVSEFLK